MCLMRYSLILGELKSYILIDIYIMERGRYMGAVKESVSLYLEIANATVVVS